MFNNNPQKISFHQRLLNRIGNPLEWSYVDKTLFLLVIDFLWKVPIFLRGYFENPHIGPSMPHLTAPFFNYSTVLIFGKFCFVVILLQASLIAICLMIRHRRPESRWPAYGYAILLTVLDTYLAIGLGHSSNLMTVLIPFWLILIGMIFFDLFFVSISLFLFVFILISSITLEQLGIIHYAFLLKTPPYTDGMIHSRWVSMNLWIVGSTVPAMLIIIGYIFNRWRKREAQVADLSELLKKMFGRYLSTEVMNTLIEHPAALELGGEKRAVTIMMTDLRGFTALSERLEPEQVVQMLNTYFEVMMDVVLKYSGTINKIIGDALLIIFGAPQEMPDRAQRAIACSIEMQNIMKQVNDQNRAQSIPELEMGIGLNEAEVIVGNIGSTKRSSYTAIGSGVNMASRIESYTVGGQILISESVRQEAGGVLRIDAKRDVLPKGAQTPLRIYDVGGIAGRFNLALEKEDPALISLVRQIQLLYTALEGKDIREKRREGSIIRLSKNCAEIKLCAPVELMTNLKINLKDVEAELDGKDLYGKVISCSENDKHSHLIRFTSVPPEVDAYFQSHRQHAEKPSV